jgi:hypothetical protein
MRWIGVLIVLIGGLTFGGTAHAAVPALLGVTQEDRHPTVTLAAPGANDVTIYNVRLRHHPELHDRLLRGSPAGRPQAGPAVRRQRQAIVLHRRSDLLGGAAR